MSRSHNSVYHVCRNNAKPQGIKTNNRQIQKLREVTNTNQNKNYCWNYLLLMLLLIIFFNTGFTFTVSYFKVMLAILVFFFFLFLRLNFIFLKNRAPPSGGRRFRVTNHNFQNYVFEASFPKSAASVRGKRLTILISGEITDRRPYALQDWYVNVIYDCSFDLSKGLFEMSAPNSV